MEKRAYEKAKKRIGRLAKKHSKQQEKVLDAEKTLSEYVDDVIITNGLEGDLDKLKEIIDLLPACVYRFNLADRYIDLKNQADKNE